MSGAGDSKPGVSPKGGFSGFLGSGCFRQNIRAIGWSCRWGMGWSEVWGFGWRRNRATPWRLGSIGNGRPFPSKKTGRNHHFMRAG